MTWAHIRVVSVPPMVRDSRAGSSPSATHYRPRLLIAAALMGVIFWILPMASIASSSSYATVTSFHAFAPDGSHVTLVEVRGDGIERDVRIAEFDVRADPARLTILALPPLRGCLAQDASAAVVRGVRGLELFLETTCLAGGSRLEVFDLRLRPDRRKLVRLASQRGPGTPIGLGADINTVVGACRSIGDDVCVIRRSGNRLVESPLDDGTGSMDEARLTTVDLTGTPWSFGGRDDRRPLRVSVAREDDGALIRFSFLKTEKYPATALGLQVRGVPSCRLVGAGVAVRTPSSSHGASLFVPLRFEAPCNWVVAEVPAANESETSQTSWAEAFRFGADIDSVVVSEYGGGIVAVGIVPGKAVRRWTSAPLDQRPVTGVKPWELRASVNRGEGWTTVVTQELGLGWGQLAPPVEVIRLLPIDASYPPDSHGLFSSEDCERSSPLIVVPSAIGLRLVQFDRDEFSELFVSTHQVRPESPPTTELPLGRATDPCE